MAAKYNLPWGRGGSNFWISQFLRTKHVYPLMLTVWSSRCGRLRTLHDMAKHDYCGWYPWYRCWTEQRQLCSDGRLKKTWPEVLLLHVWNLSYTLPPVDGNVWKCIPPKAIWSGFQPFPTLRLAINRPYLYPISKISKTATALMGLTGLRHRGSDVV